MRGNRDFFFTKGTRINGVEEETMDFFKGEKMTNGEEEIFHQISTSDLPRDGDNTSHDKSALRCIKNRAI